MPQFDVLADTSVIIPWLRREPAATRFLESRRVGICAVALAEVRVGLMRAYDPVAALERMWWILFGVPTVHLTDQTASVYANIHVALQAVGRPIPTNDVWIAASALEWNVPLVARDAHFSRIVGLTVLSC